MTVVFPFPPSPPGICHPYSRQRGSIDASGSAELLRQVAPPGVAEEHLPAAAVAEVPDPAGPDRVRAKCVPNACQMRAWECNVFFVDLRVPFSAWLKRNPEEK